MRYHNVTNSPCYFPPLLGNGEITLSPDCEGTLRYTKDEFVEKGVNAFDGIVVRCGRRTGVRHDEEGRDKMFPFGKFIFREGSDLKEWSQELDPVYGVVTSHCSYEDGVEIDSECFLHPEKNLYALKKTFHGIGSGAKAFSYDFILDGYCEFVSELMTYTASYTDGNCAHIGFRMYGQDIYVGETVVMIDKKCSVTIGSPEQSGNMASAGSPARARLAFEAAENESVVFYYFLEDNLECTDYHKALADMKMKILSTGYEGLLQENNSAKQAFEDLGYVKTYDEKLNSIYRTSLYDLQSYTTKYSIPVGLNNDYWHGHFFAFDEYYGFLGLLGANRLKLAKRVPAFRLEVCLEKAIFRASKRHEEEARFFWQTSEYGEELSLAGFWIDHVFHMPLVAMSAWEYYEHSGDLEFLQKCYRMIRACAKFFSTHMIYRDAERVYVGKCTDLERLGSSRENPFMTACSAIKALECAAAAAKVLQTDEEYREECLTTARLLRENLPVENNMYVPYLGCDQKSVAVFAGKFPYNVLPHTDEKLMRAWEDFEKNGGKYGNMYNMGVHLSPWYACWKAEGYARCGMADKAYEALRQSYLSVGVFDEMFEINEPGVRLRPWFSTACGIFLSTVNEMLLQSDGETIHILPAFPVDSEKGDVAFKLSAKGGAIVEAEIVKGKLIKLDITMRDGSVPPAFKVLFGSERVEDSIL